MAYLLKNRFLIFLFFLLSLIIVTPFLRNPKIAELFLIINYSILLLSGLYAFSTEKKFFRYSATFFIISIILDWLHYLGVPGNFIDAIQPLITAVIIVSLLAMTTLGYGDISPTIPQSRSLAILLSILGPMYVAVIVALMVGKFSSTFKTKE